MPATPPETLYDVFISYSHRDKAWVKGELLPRLEKAGLKVCLDDRDFRIGAPIVREMERAVLTSRHTIAVLTPAYLSSAWADFEALMIATLDPGSQQERLLPLLLEPCDVPIRMKYLGYADFAAPDDLALSWRRLLDALAASVDPGTKPDTAWPAENAGPATPPPAPAFNTAAVRELLMAAFSDEELTTFCYDNFRPVYEEFATGMSRTQKVQMFVAYCERRGQMADLLARVERANPYQYARFGERLRSVPPPTPKPPDPNPLPANPFGDTLAVRNSERFIGRESELRRLQAMLAGGSVALQGEAKIGKSSLLWRLKTTWGGEVIGPLDCQELENRHDFYACLAEALGVGETGWQAIRRALKSQTSLLLLDELDVGPSLGLTYEDLARFRGVCNNYAGLKIVTVSRKPLKDVFPDPGRGSEAYNFLVPLTLGLMSEAESQRLLTHPWVSTAPQFEPAIRDELMKPAGGHPFKLQRAAFHRYEALVDSTYDWQAAYRQDVENLL